MVLRLCEAECKNIGFSFLNFSILDTRTFRKAKLTFKLGTDFHYKLGILRKRYIFVIGLREPIDDHRIWIFRL